MFSENALRKPAKLPQKDFRMITEFGDPKQSCGSQFCAQIKAMRGPPQPWNIKYMSLSFLISIIDIFFINIFEYQNTHTTPIEN